VARSPKLSLDARGGELSKQIFVKVTLGVAIGQWEFVDTIDGRNQETLLLDQQLGVLHVFAEFGTIKGHAAKMRKYLVPHMWQHIHGGEILETTPAQSLAVLGFRKNTFERLAGSLGAFFVAGFVDVKQACEHQEGNLFNDRQRIGDASGPEFFPEFIDLTFKRSGDHARGAAPWG